MSEVVKNREVWLGMLILMFLLLPHFPGTYILYLASLAGVYTIVSVGLNLLFSYTGLISIGYAAFLETGAYTTAILLTRAPAIPFPVTLILSGLLAAVLGLIVGLPALRLSGHYLAMATMGFGFVMEEIFLHWESATKGTLGIAVPKVSIGPIRFVTGMSKYYLILFFGLNLYGNCSHKCRYCYNQERSAGLRFDRLTKIATLSGIEHALKLMEDRGDMRHVHLSFLGDIYDLGRKDNSYTRQVLSLFRRYRHPFQVLTKGGLRAADDFDLFFDTCRYGANLTFIDEPDSLHWEPKSALPAERLESLEMAKAWGIETWVSCEPVIDPAQTLELIREAAPYVDFFAIGKINHYPDLEAAVNWMKFRSDAETLLQKLNKPYLIKNELKAAAIWQEAL